MKEEYARIIEMTGENIYRPGLAETPERASKAFRFMTQGYNQDLKTVIHDALFPSDNNEPVVVQNIEFYSLCEHHLLPFFGKCHIAYIPQGKVLGLSKFARIVDMFARRLQIQENLTKQIAQTIMDITGASGVMVIMDAQHLCMMMRGVEKQESTTTTSARLGEFHDNHLLSMEYHSILCKESH